MTLRPTPDVSAADWWVGADAGWRALADQGPPTFDAYATVWLHDVGDEHFRSDEELFQVVTGTCTEHTTTPEDAFFGLWDGWADLDGGERISTIDLGADFGRIFTPAAPRRPPPAFPERVLEGPRVRLLGDGDEEMRAYLLFHGPLSMAGEWGATPLAADWPRAIAPPSIAWPADRAWFVAADAEASFLTVGGTDALARAIIDHPDLRAEAAAYGTSPERAPS